MRIKIQFRQIRQIRWFRQIRWIRGICRIRQIRRVRWIRRVCQVCCIRRIRVCIRQIRVLKIAYKLRCLIMTFNLITPKSLLLCSRRHRILKRFHDHTWTFERTFSCDSCDLDWSDVFLYQEYLEINFIC